MIRKIKISKIIAWLIKINIVNITDGDKVELINPVNETLFLR